VHVFISDPSSLRSLQEFLRRAECVAEQCRSDVLDVYVPNASNDRYARRDLNVYLATWQANNGGIEAYILEQNGSRARSLAPMPSSQSAPLGRPPEGEATQP
jgi:hypothetical protein